MTASILLTCLAGLPAPAAAPVPEPADLKALADLAARHHLPLPPKDARLVLAHTDRWLLLGNQSRAGDPAIYAPAFLLEEKPDGTAVVLLGTERHTTTRIHKSEPATRKFSPDRVAGTPRGYQTEFDGLSTLVCAVQVAARKEYATARVLLDRYTGGDPDVVKNVPHLLAAAAYQHHYNRLLAGASNWRDVRDRMTALFAEFPDLRDEVRDALLADLTATLEAKPPTPGSIEAEVVAWAGRSHRFWSFDLFHDNGPADPHAPARRVVLCGYDAIPGLIALLADRRVTAHESPSFNKIPASVKRLGGLAGSLLREVVGDGTPEPPDGSDPKAWRDWWEVTRATPERDYFLGAVFLTNGGRITRVNDTIARIIAEKWPEALPGLCDRFTERADADASPHGLSKALAASRLPKAERVKVLAAFAGRGPLGHRLAPLSDLQKIDPAAATAVLRPLLGTLKRDVDGPYWRCDEGYVAGYLVGVEDDAVWREYVRVLRGSSVGLRMEGLKWFAHTHHGAKNRALRLAFLAAFLDDEAVRDIDADPKRYSGPCAAFTIPRIAVRDFAAAQIAVLLKLDDDPDEDWTAAQWAGLRAKVRAKLAAETLPDPGGPPPR